MCDTVVKVEGSRVLFAKNSDRDPNEAQFPEWHPSRRHPANFRLHCTYIEIPQVERTHAILISRPYWMWGAEIGTNEHGVTIGNEAVFTRQPYAATGLTGMDLLRLALERSDSAEGGVRTITALLEEYGQGGGCGHENRRFTYHNSFIVADPDGAFVLETAGKHWAVEEVKGARSISNGLTIPAFARRHSDFIKTSVSECRVRRKITQERAERSESVGDFFALLREHGGNQSVPEYSWLNGGMKAPCMHAGGLAVSSQATASWVAELRPGGVRHWVTATAAPCTGLFKPVRVEAPVAFGQLQGDRADDSLWWRHENLHRMIARNPEQLLPLIAGERDRTETDWLTRPPDSGAAFRESESLLARWTETVAGQPARDVRPWYVRRYWSVRNRRAGLAALNLQSTIRGRG